MPVLESKKQPISKKEKLVLENLGKQAQKNMQGLALALQELPIISLRKMAKDLEKASKSLIPTLNYFPKIDTSKHLILKEDLLKMPDMDLSSIGAMQPRNQQYYLLEKQNYLLEKLLEENIKKTQLALCTFSKVTGAVIINTTPQDAFNFNDFYDDNNMQILFEVLWEALEERGKIVNVYKQVGIPREEIRKRVKAKIKQDVDDKWITNTVSNLKNKKLKKREEFLFISLYKKNINGYLFRVKIQL